MASSPGNVGINWTGTISTDWNNPCNWNPAWVPDATNSAVVIDLRTNQPTITSTVPAVKQIYVNANAILTVSSGGTLNSNSTVASITLQGGNLINDGTINLSGGGSGIGISIGATASITNRGTITTNNLYGIALGFGNLTFTNEGTGIYNGDVKVNDNILTLTNRGTINYAGGTFALSLNTGSNVINDGTINITGGSGISNPSGSTITNNACSKIFMSAGEYENAGTTTNAGLIQMPNLHNFTNAGTFTNNGVLKANTVSGITNNRMVVTNACPIFTLAGSNNYTVSGIFTDAGATTSAGTYTSAGNKFTANNTIPTGTQTLYAQVTNGTCTFTVPFNFENKKPTAVSVNNTAICTGASVTLSGTCPSGTTLTWYTTAMGGSNIGTGTNLSVSPTVTTTYYAACEATNCISGRVATSAVTVSNPPSASASSNTPICAGATLNLVGGSMGNTYSWRGPNSFTSTELSPSIANSTALATGTYTITVTNAGSCTATATVAVTVNAVPTATASSSTPVICAGSNISLTGGGVGTYLWSGPNGYSSTAQSPVITNATTSSAGTYTITVTGAGSCVSTATVAVTVNTQPTITSVANLLDNNTVGQCGKIIPYNSSTTGIPTPTVSYVITGATSASGSGNGGGTFFNVGTSTIVLTATNSCGVGTYSFTITVNDRARITPTASSNSPVCVGSPLSLIGNPAGNTYAWSGPNSFSSTAQSPNVTNSTSLSAGIYTVAVTNVSNCTSTATTSVTVNTVPTATASSSTPVICAGSNISLTGGGVGTYLWSGPNGYSSTAQSPTINDATVSATGIYTITVSNSNSCTSTATTSITVNAVPTATASSSTPVICAGNNISLTGGGVGTYLWSGPNGYSSMAQSPTINNATVSATGIYTITVSNSNSCTSTATTSITVNAVPTATASSNSPVCSGVTLQLTGGGVGTYLWNGSNGFTSTAQNPSIASETLFAGTYNFTILVTNVSGCTSTATTSVTVNGVLTANATPSNQTICSGDAITTLAITGTGTSYTWTRDNTGSVTGITDSGSGNISGSLTNTTEAPITVTFTITPVGSCNGTPTTATVIVNPTPTVTASTPSQSICSGATITGITFNNPPAFGPQTPDPSSDIVPTEKTNTTQAIAFSSFVAGTVFNWTRDNTATVTGIAASGSGNISGSLTNTTASPITVTFTVTPSYTNAGKACTGTPITVTVTVNPNPTAIITDGGTAFCSGISTTLSVPADPNYTYAWERSLTGIANPNSFTAFGGTAQTQVVTTSGVYRAVVTNQYNCSSRDTTAVKFGDFVFRGSLSAGDAQQTGRMNRFAELSTCAAPKGYPGNFTTTGARFYDSYTVTNPTNAPICATIGLSSGCGTSLFSAAYLGSFDPNSLVTNYLADPGSSFPGTAFYEATIPANGTIVVVVHEVNSGTGCSNYDLRIDVPGLTVVPTASSNSPVCAGNTLNLTGTGTGTYSWAGPNNFTSTLQNPSIANATTLATGTYTFSVTNAGGCVSNATTAVTVNANPTVTASSNSPICVGNTLNLTSGTAASYSWTGPNSFTSTAQNPTITNATTLTTGTYTITVTNANSCTSTATVSVMVNSLPTATAISNSPVCAGNTLNLLGGGLSIPTLAPTGSYAWTGPNSFSSSLQNPSIPSVTTAATGTYQLIITNPNGCTAMTTTSVTVNPLPTATASSNSPICAGTTLNLTGGGVGTYSWTGVNGFTSTDQNPSIPNASILSSGTYQVTVTNINGCTASATTSVTVNPTPATPTPQADTQIIFGGSISLTATGCSGTGDVLKWYQTSDNLLVTMPVSPTVTTQYYAKCEVTANGITCISGNSNNVTVTVLQLQPPVATGATNCLATPTTLTATGCSGSTGTFVLKWYQNADDALVMMPVSPSISTDYYARCEQTFNSVTAVSEKSNVVTLTILNPPTPVATGGTIYNGQSISLTATGCTGTGFTIKWYKTSDNGLIIMPVSPTVTTQYYAQCEQTANSVTCTSVKSNDVTVTVANRIFVDINKISAPIQNGNSWATAYGNLQTGLAAATAGVEVWVAKGTYRPTTTTDRTIYFNIPSGVVVYGGFVGTEDNLIDRNFRTNISVLSGDIGTINMVSDNSYHVVSFDGSRNTTVLDGFTITGGYANFDTKRLVAIPIAAPPSTVTIETGGGIVVQNAGMPIISNCTIVDNAAVTGGGIYAGDASIPDIVSCVITSNQATFGSGFYFQDGSNGIVRNSLVSGNRGIGVIYSNKSNPVIINCTIAGNGGYNGGIFNSASQPTIKNTILWNNASPFNDTQSVITYSIVQGGYAGTGNLNYDPQFINSIPEGLSPTANGDYRLQGSSLAIDRGDNTGISLTDIDLEGNLRRFNGGTVDMGAFEFQGSPTSNLVISAQTGDWEISSTWVGFKVPQLGDVVIIDNSHVVTIKTTATAKNIEYRGTGHIKFNGAAAKLNIGF
ncbi:MAG: PKD-like domain-containing protein [Arcicella sp.]|nr:PKD-like domain-containing protein [Arcicella sp.]